MRRRVGESGEPGIRLYFALVGPGVPIHKTTSEWLAPAVTYGFGQRREVDGRLRLDQVALRAVRLLLAYRDANEMRNCGKRAFRPLGIAAICGSEIRAIDLGCSSPW